MGAAKKVRMRHPVQGRKEGFCRQCHGKDDKPWYHHSAMRAVYVREPKRGFVRVGWLFEECGHVEVEKDSLAELVKVLDSQARGRMLSRRLKWFADH